MFAMTSFATSRFGALRWGFENALGDDVVRGGIAGPRYAILSLFLFRVSSDLNLYPAKEWKEKGWDWCDSMDPQRELDGFSDADVPDPEKGQEG